MELRHYQNVMHEDLSNQEPRPGVPNCGPRAKFGPGRHFIRPAKLFLPSSKTFCQQWKNNTFTKKLWIW